MARRIDLNEFRNSENRFPKTLEGVTFNTIDEFERTKSFVEENIEYQYREYLSDDVYFDYGEDYIDIDARGNGECFDSEFDIYYCRDCGDSFEYIRGVLEHCLEHVRRRTEDEEH